jgi:hypothetical protein
MLDVNEIFELKNKYGKLYSVVIKNIDFIFRELTFKEYNTILYHQQYEDLSSADIEDLIISCAVVEPKDFNLAKIPAGTVSILAQEILDLSGFFSPKIAKSILEEKRIESNEVKNLMKAFVLATITSYTPEDLEDMTFSELAQHVALSEKVIEIRQAMNGVQYSGVSLELVDPEEEEQKAKQTAEKHDKAKPTGAAGYQDPIAQKLWGMR